MVITKFIRKNCIVPELTSNTKADVLQELNNLLFTPGSPEAENALDQILSRESTESTGIGRGIAVPHARVTGLKTMQCAVGRVPAGLDFAAIDREPVHLIFLICYPPTEQTKYLNFVATAARLLRDKEYLDQMLTAETAEDMYTVLEEASTAFTEKHEEDYAEKKDDENIDQMKDAHASLILLARLQLNEEMLDTAKTGKTQLKKRIATIRGLIDPRILSHYDRLAKTRKPSLVSVEGDTCQGCFMRLASQFVQQVRQDTAHVHMCQNCKRFIYVV